MKKLLKALFVLAFLLLLPSAVYASSPITSASFYDAYMDYEIVKTAKAEGIMTLDIGNYLSSPDNPLDVKAAVINALGWDTAGKHNAEYYSYLIYKKPLKYLDLDQLSGDDLFCLGYLTAMDNYFTPSKSFQYMEKAGTKIGSSYTFNIVYTLIKAQESYNNGSMSSIWKLVESIQSNSELNQDMRTDAKKLIMDYLSTYSKYGNSLYTDPSLLILNAEDTITAIISGGDEPYTITSACSEAYVTITGSTLNVTGIRHALTQVTITDKSGRSLTVPIMVNPPTAEKRLKNSIALFIDSPIAYINGVKSAISSTDATAAPIIKENSTIVPVRFLAQAMNATLQVDPTTSCVVINAPGYTIKLTPGSNIMDVNTMEKKMPLPVEIDNGVMYVPLKAFAEAMGKKVFYDRKLIILSDSDAVFDIENEKGLIDDVIGMFQINNRGNTSGNTTNQGLAALQGNWIYFSNSSDSGRLYRMKLDGSSKSLLSNNSCAFINVSGDWIYYCNLSDNEKIYRIKTDGSEEAKVCDDRAGYVSCSGGLIYYQNYDDGNKIYSIKADGTERTLICQDNSKYLCISDQYIYYSNTLDDYKLYRVRLDGSDRVKVNDDSSWFINVSGDWIYYSNMSDGEKLYRIKADGSEKTRLNYDKSWFINVSGDWIYYNSSAYVNELYKVKTDGSERIRLSGKNARFINVTGDYVFYQETTQDGKTELYKINTDGSGIMKIE